MWRAIGGGAQGAAAAARGARRPTWAAVPALALVVLALAAGCDVDTGNPLPNQAPTVFLAEVGGGTLDTTNYRQVLHWWGSDPDGEVVAYVYKWSGAWRAPADSARWQEDTTFVLTTATRDSFVVPIEGTFGTPTFTVRAIDDRGAVSLPKSQTYSLSNERPTVFWKSSPPLPSVSLPAVTFFWGGTDPDGYGTIAFYKIWLEGESENEARIVRGDSVYTITPDDFAHLGENTVHVRPVDEALAEGNVISHTWTVEGASGAALLIDAVRNGANPDAGAEEFDAFYRANLDTLFGAGNYYVLDLEQRDFRTPAEVAPTMGLFPVVVWYTGLSLNDPSREAAQFSRAAEGIRDYVEDGGSILVTSMTAVGTAGGIGNDIAAEIFGVSRFYADTLGTTNLVVPRSTVFHPSATWADSLQTRSTFGGTTATTRVRYGVDCFEPWTGATTIYFVPPHTLDTANGIVQETDYAVGAENAPAGVGRTILLTFPIARADFRGNGGTQFREHVARLAASSPIRTSRSAR